MGINIKFVLDPMLKHINLRKEVADDEEILCADLKIEGAAHIGPRGDLIQKLLGCTADEAFRFWITDEPAEGDNAADPAFTGIEFIKSWASFDGGHTLHIAGLQLRPSRLSKFQFKPRSGHTVELIFSASVRGLTDSHLDRLANVLLGEVKCHIEADPDLLDGLEGADQ